MAKTMKTKRRIYPKISKRRPFHYYVLHWDTNHDELVKYDVGLYFTSTYMSIKPKDRPTDFDSLSKFLDDEAFYMFKSRCEHEFLITSWPPSRKDPAPAAKIDIYYQLHLNWPTFVQAFQQTIIINN